MNVNPTFNMLEPGLSSKYAIDVAEAIRQVAPRLQKLYMRFYE